MTTPLMIRMREKNPAAVARAAQLTAADVERILGYDPKIPDTPENRADFVAAWLLQGAEVDHWDIAIWFAATEEERDHLIAKRYKETNDAATVERYGGLFCDICGLDYREMEGAKDCCHPLFIADLATEWKADEEDRREQEYD
jgi:hypothetical protein